MFGTNSSSLRSAFAQSGEDGLHAVVARKTDLHGTNRPETDTPELLVELADLTLCGPDVDLDAARDIFRRAAKPRFLIPKSIAQRR